MEVVIVSDKPGLSDVFARQILENMDEAFTLLDAGFRVLDLNQLALSIDGRPREQIIGRSVWELAPGLDQSDFGKLLKQSMKQRTAVTAEHYQEWADNHAAWIEARAFPVGEGLAVVYRDMSARRQADDALRSSEEFNRRILQSSTDCIKVLSLAGRLEFMSEGGTEVMEVEDLPSLLGKDWKEFWPEQERHKILQALSEATQGRSFRFQGQAATAKGNMRWWDVAVSPILGADGKPERLLSISRDLSATLWAEQRLAETSRRLDAILENTTMAVFLMDDRQDCIFANAAAEKLTGYSFEELSAQPLHDVIHRKKPDGSPYPLEECPIDRAFPERSQTQGEELFVAPDGSFYPVAFTASPVADEDGTAIGTVIEVRSIAEEIAQKDALEEKSRILGTLYRTGVAVAAELDLERVVQTVVDAGVDLTGARFGAFFYTVQNEAGEALMLYSLSGANQSDFEGFGMPRATQIFKPTFDGEGVLRSDDILADPRYGKNAPHEGMPKGHLPVRSYLAVPVSSRSGEVLGGLFFGHPEPSQFSEEHETLMLGIAAQAAIAIDNARLFRDAQVEIENRRRSEKHQKLLINELNHRVKNTLAIVQSLAQQTFKSDIPSPIAKGIFEGRLSALAAAHSLLTQGHWEETSLADIVSASVAAASGSAASQVTCEGPEVMLPPQTAVSFAMAVHELSTNALKYGALSREEGRVSVVWNLGANDRPRLQFEWREIDGPAVNEPSKSGFGTRLIRRGLAAELCGEVELKFETSGLRCIISAPLPGA